MTTRDDRRQDMQAFIDTLSTVERHQICRALNAFPNLMLPYDVQMLRFIRRALQLAEITIDPDDPQLFCYVGQF